MKILLKTFCNFLLTGYCFFSVCFASMNGTLSIGTKGKRFTNGDIVDAQLFIQPWEEMKDEHFLNKYIGTNFLEYFHIVNVENVQIVDGLFKADIRMIIKKSFDGQGEAQLSLEEYAMSVAIKKNEFVANKKNIEEFILFDQFEKIDRTAYHMLMALLVMAGLIMPGLGLRYYGKRKVRMKMVREAQEERENLISLMKNVRNKEDIQSLYAKREQMKEIVVNTHQFKEALNMIDEHQYKNSVSGEIIDKIRDKLSNGI